MASSGSGSSGAASGNYSSAGKGAGGCSAGNYGKSIAGSYAGKGLGGYGCSKGAYGKSGLYDGVGTGYGKGKNVGNRLENRINEITDFYFKKPSFASEYLRSSAGARNLADKYSLREMLMNVLLINAQRDHYQDKNGMKKKVCPRCGGDSEECGCRN